jgi:hypothetical protein
VHDGLRGRAACWLCVPQQKTYAFERARSYGVYDEPLGEWFAERLAAVAKQRGSALAAAGYNQAAGPESWVCLLTSSSPLMARIPTAKP